jgi:hypothetical protein
MFYMTATAGMFTSIWTIKNIAEAMIELRDAEVIKGEVFELQSKMLEAHLLRSSAL